MYSMADITLGIKKCSMIVAQILADYEPEFLEWHDKFGYMGASFSTRPLYNGRETGLVFQMSIPKGTINVFVAEHRIAEDIVVKVWESGRPEDTLSVHDYIDKVNDLEYHFDYNKHVEVADYVYDTFKNFYNSKKAS